MKTPLDQIENRLQAFIETTINPFRANPGGLLAHRLIEALQETLSLRPDGVYAASPGYAIAMHPDDLAAWQAHPEWLTGLVQVMGQAAWDEGLAFESGLRLSLQADQRLLPGNVSVESIPEAAPVEQTGVMASGAENQKEAGDPRPQNAFLILENGAIFPLRLVAINIGRRLENHLVIDDPRVSRSHAQLRAVRGSYTLFDLNSTGGTYVNSQRVSQHSLRPGDVISLAGVALIYGEDAPLEPPPAHDDTAAYPSHPDEHSSPGHSTP